MGESAVQPRVTEPSYLRYFPYDAPYTHQQEAMARIHETLESGSDMLFEGATGTGKTLAALAPALEHARETGRTVVITTNVHQQMRQFRREASAIADSEPIRAVVFQGKSSMCHIDVGYEECQALRETTRDLVDTEQELAELEREQQALLERSQGGDTEATSARASLMDDIEALQDSLASFEDRATCRHYYRNLTADTTEFFEWLYDDVRTPEEIYGYADSQGFCGYELLKEGVEGVDLVVCNYHHLLDPVIREQFFRWLGRDPEDVIGVFDEAHNIESAARDHARQTLTGTTLARALDELDGVEDPRAGSAGNVLATFHDALQESYNGALAPGERPDVDEHWTDLHIDNDDRRDALTLAFLRAYTGPGYETELDRAVELGRELDSAYERAYKNGETSTRRDCPTLAAATFVDSWLADSDDSDTYPVVSVRRHETRDGRPNDSGDDPGAGAALPGAAAAARDGTSDRHPDPGEVYGRAELYTCIPSRVTRSLFADLHASVLMSATLRPFGVTEDVLGLEGPETMAYGPQFPERRRRTYAVDGPALFARRRDDTDLQRTITDTLADIVRVTPGNTLAFFPSYSEAARYHDRVAAGTGYLDEAGTAARELRESFTGDDDGVLFTSLWGTLGEGVSYDGDDARTVVVVGVPYPHLDDRMAAVQDAYKAAFGGGDAGETHEEDAGWRYAVEIPTVRKTRQALGRVVRSPADFGARILLDARYTERSSVEMPGYSVRGAFPPEERAEMVDIDPEKLRFGLLNFYQKLDAYSGDPPAP